MHGHGGGCKLHGPTYQVFLRFSDPGSVELRESRRPHVEGVPCPPPPPKKSGHQFSCSSGRVPIFLVGTPSEPAAGVCPENFGSLPSQKIRTPFSPQFRGVSRFFFQETAVGVCPENFGYPPPFGGGSRGVRGSRCSPGLLLLVSSNTPFILLRFFPCYGRRLDIEMHQMLKTDKS